MKAAVSKYGLQQWTRVASLLAKKTAKQAKARWNEYLDPRLRKEDWSPEEDEKLLNLARLLPNQWRSIAESFGRTAAQCVERYQTLLDETSGSMSSNDLGLTGSGAENAVSIGSTSVQVGDLNIDAETKIARPDAVDLDDDEKEMLSEARARLANTKGKKATRKEREKMLAESKRIALLQKRRDLKQAGITTKLSAPKKKYATQKDYNADIVFEHRPTEGFYDTSEEIQANDKQLNKFERDVNYSGLDSDKQKNKEKRPRNETKPQQNNEIEKAPIINVDETFKRRKLNLPEPEFNDVEMDELSKKSEEQIQATLEERVTREQTLDNKLKIAAEKVKEYTTGNSALLITEEADLLEDEDHSIIKEEAPIPEKTTISILDKLANLPKPKNDYEIEIEERAPKAPAPQSKNVILEDEGERQRLEQVARKQQEQAALLRRSYAVQKGLPIPDLDSSFKFREESNIDKQMITLIRSDYTRFKKPQGAKVIPDLNQHLREEIIKEMKNLIDSDELKQFQDQFVVQHTKSFQPNVDPSSLIDELNSMVEECAAREEQINQDTNNYIEQHNTLWEQNMELLQELQDVDRAEAAFEMLRQGELISLEARRFRLNEETERLIASEQRAQQLLLELKRNRS